MAPGGAVILCEERIREQSGLAAPRDLAELRSLSIPGTYQEKITHLGNSLMRLTGLRSLDLSRNSLVSLEGIQYLTVLERLNLYYNCISSLAEVFRLHPLLTLTEVDFRLNPVVKSESDYRLFVVHMLPNLRQLDDRPVRENERKASQLHFTSEDLLDSKCGFPAPLKGERPHRCRARYSDSSSQCLALDADDEAVLSLIAECEWDLSSPPGSTGSSQREREAAFPGVRECRPVLSPPSVWHQCGDPAQRGPERRTSSSLAGRPEKQPQGHCHQEEPEARAAHAPRFLLPTRPDSTDTGDSMTSSQKSSSSTPKVADPVPVSEKYRKRRMPGGRFQVYPDQECLGCLAGATGPLTSEESLARLDSLENTSEGTCLHPEIKAPEAEELAPRDSNVAQEHVAAPPGRTAALQTALLEALLDLVDKHWGGCRSLHSNGAFLAQARRVLSSAEGLTVTQTATELDREVAGYLALENEALRGHLAEQEQRHRAKADEARAELEAAQRAADDLKDHLDKSLEENSSLKSLLCSMKKEAESAGAATTLSVQIAGLQTSVTRLSGEIAELKQHLEHYDKIQELIHMLQESHSSLVSTNEQLLQELGRVRALHRAEVEQLHWSYHELKKTVALFPQRSAAAATTRD